MQLVWNTKDRDITKYQTTDDLVNDMDLIKQFKKEIDNSMSIDEIKTFICKYCHDEIDIDESDDECEDDFVNYDENFDDYRQNDDDNDMIDFRDIELGHQLIYIYIYILHY